jgi:TRAP-type C4-dicarboxylate transport system permease small subunit
MQRIVDGFYKLLEILLVLILAAMVVMVFGNVVLRYFFDSGVTVSEEMARYCFVWLTFIAAVVSFREHGHLGVETLVQKLPRAGRLACMAGSNLLILLCAGVLFWGAWRQREINATTFSPVVGLSMLWVYGVGMFTGAGLFLIALIRLVRQFLGRITEEEIAIFAGEIHTTEEVA